MTNTRRRGFTLVELLVVIAIIGILMSLTVPAVMIARSAARRGHCMNRQKDLALTVQIYEGSNGQLPGYINIMSGRTVSWPVELLEAMDGQAKLSQAWKDGADLTATVPALICPSAITKGDGVLSYAANTGRWDGTAGPVLNGVLNDATLSPPRRLTTDKIPGGSEHTVIFTENLQATSWVLPPAPTPLSGNFVGDLGFVWSLEPTKDCTAAGASNTPVMYPNACNEQAISGTVAFARPSSFHPGGVGVAFLSGRTEFLNNDIDPDVYLALVSIED